MSQPVAFMLTGVSKFSIRDKQKGKYIHIYIAHTIYGCCAL